MILIARIKEIKEVVCTSSENVYNVKINEVYSLISIDSPEYIVGFEGDDFSLKNYTIWKAC